MAKTAPAPTKRRSMRAKLAAKLAEGPQPYAPRKASRPDAAPVTDSFAESKRDKRHIKHASFVSRIQKSHAKTPTKRRRRPGNKLVADLESLSRALPDLLADGETEEGLRQLREGKVRHKSLKSRPGALKKKEKVVKGEVERFGVNLARLNAVAASDKNGGVMEVETDEAPVEEGAVPAPSATASRWAALRGFISATMEQNPAFIGKETGK